MAQPKVFRTTAFENTEKVLLNYVTNLDDVAVGQEQIDTITYRVWSHDEEGEAEDAENGTEVGDEANLSVVSTIFDDLQTDNGWPANLGDGWNCKVTLPAARFPTGAAWVRAEITITPSQTYGDGPFYIVWLIQVLPIASN